MSDPHIQIGRSELYTKEVEEALARDKQLRRRTGGEPPPISPIRKVLYNSLFYLPFAAVLGMLGLWLLTEPYINDVSVIGGEVKLIDNDPFIYRKGIKQITIGDKSLLVLEQTKLEKGAGGEPALPSLEEIKEGDFIEAAVQFADDEHAVAIAIRPASEAHATMTGTNARGTNKALMFLLFPLVGTALALSLLTAEGISSRNWSRMVERTFLGSLLAAVFTLVSLFIPGAVLLYIGQKIVEDGNSGLTIKDFSPGNVLTWIAFRSAAWAGCGAALGVGMNLVRSTKVQLRNSVLGGALGGALGGLLFDPIDRFARSTMFADAGYSRLAGFIMIGLFVGLFVALVERLAREAWIRVRTGPLAGKSFVLYKTPTTLGSSPSCDVYLFKDAEIDASHAQIHRVGQNFEIEDMGSRMGTKVGSAAVRRRRLASGDQIVLGATVLEFEERAKRSANA